MLIKLQLETESPLEKQTTLTTCTCINGKFPPCWILPAKCKRCPARIPCVVLWALLRSHLLQLSHTPQIGSAILIKLCRRFCDCENHRERRTSNTVCMKSTSWLESTRDKMLVQLKREASQPLLSLFFFLKSKTYHLRCLFFKKTACALSSENCDYIHKSNTAKSLIFKAVFSASPSLFRETTRYRETETPVPIHTHNTNPLTEPIQPWQPAQWLEYLHIVIFR